MSVAIAEAAGEAAAAPSRAERFPLFNGLRAIAALSVVLFHVAQQTGAPPGRIANIMGHLNIGVVVFFVISGFLLYRPFVAARHGLGPAISTRAFYARRGLRIFPGYWAALTILAIWPGLHAVLTNEAWKHYLLVHTWFNGTHGTGLNVAWSLCAEIAFYAALPAYAVAARRLGWRADLAVLAALAVLSLGAHQMLDGDRGVSLPGTFYLFAVGMGIAVLSVQDRASRWNLGRHTNALVLWAAAAVLFIAMSVRTSGASPVYPPYLIVATLLVTPAVFGDHRKDPVRRFLALPAITWLGLVSYGIYLWHRPLIEQLDAHGLHATTWAEVAAVIAITIPGAIALGSASYYLIERRFLRLKPGR